MSAPVQRDPNPNPPPLCRKCWERHAAFMGRCGYYAPLRGKDADELRDIARHHIYPFLR